jgi:hypothetical protein
LANSNTDHCNEENCHDASEEMEALSDQLSEEYAACENGEMDARNAMRVSQGLPAIPCQTMFPTLQVTHDRTHNITGSFHCQKDSETTCSCRCDTHPPCCMHMNKLLTNEMLFANRFDTVEDQQTCCNMCHNHPECTAWEYTTEQICVLKSGVVSAESYTDNPYPDVVTTWSGTPSSVGTC